MKKLLLLYVVVCLADAGVAKDINTDGRCDLADFAALSEDWMEQAVPNGGTVWVEEDYDAAAIDSKPAAADGSWVYMNTIGVTNACSASTPHSLKIGHDTVPNAGYLIWVAPSSAGYEKGRVSFKMLLPDSGRYERLYIQGSAGGADKIVVNITLSGALIYDYVNATALTGTLALNQWHKIDLYFDHSDMSVGINGCYYLFVDEVFSGRQPLSGAATGSYRVTWGYGNLSRYIDDVRIDSGVVQNSVMDLNEDCVVGLPDLSLFLTHWLSGIQDVGIPVKAVSWVRLWAAENYPGKKMVYSTMSQDPDGFFALRIDPDTGTCEQFLCGADNSNFPTAADIALDGSLYVGAAWSGRLFHLAPGATSLSDLGVINADKATFPCRIDQDRDGNVWIGGYPACDLTKYVPSTGQFVHYGRMDPVDMYCYPMYNADGRIVCAIKYTRPHLVIFDPRTGEKMETGPVGGPQDYFELLKDKFGSVYLLHNSVYYAVNGFDVTPLTQTPQIKHDNAFSDGTYFDFEDSKLLVYRNFRTTRPGGSRTISYLDYEGTGSRIFHMIEGPDNCIYGSTYLPLHLFKYDISTGQMVDYNRASLSGGQAYSMAAVNGKVYISAYGEGNLSVYDPTLPYHYGETANDNPRHLCRISPDASRPRSTIAGPDGKIWITTVPDYGMWRGPLCSYNPVTEQKKSFYIAGEGSCYTLAYLPPQQLFAVGTTIRGGGGTIPKQPYAELILWNYATEQETWRGTISTQATDYTALAVTPSGKLFGTVNLAGNASKIFCFDPVTKAFVWSADSPGLPLDLGLVVKPDGNLFGFTSNRIYQLNTATYSIETVVSDEINGFDVPGPLIGQYLYFSKAHRLKRLKVF